MKRYWWVVLLGLLALLAFAAATMPASMLAGRLEPLGIQAVDFDGSIWSGSATGVSWHAQPIGDVQWHIRPAELLHRRVAGHVHLTRTDGELDTDFAVTFSGEVQFDAATFSAPIELLTSLPIGLPAGWRGRAHGHLEQLVLNSGWPLRLRGVVDLDQLVTPPPGNRNLGDLRIVSPHPKPIGEGTLPDRLTAQVTDRGGNGPFSIDVQLTLSPKRSFMLEGGVTARSSASEDLRQTLEFLGPIDPVTGRRPFSVSGSF
ncbi:MAG TPA: type II secretion system protein N [Steroidobacteraceae bacterium]|nr:type II secretion system protein N [Steroidobacteraceae bacterium]